MVCRRECKSCILSNTSHSIRSNSTESFNERKPVDYATGCCFCIRSDDYAEYGMFDEGYKMYCEDVDLSLRIRKHGGKIIYIPTSKVWHHVSISMGGNNSFSKWRKKYSSYHKTYFKTWKRDITSYFICIFFNECIIKFDNYTHNEKLIKKDEKIFKKDTRALHSC